MSGAVRDVAGRPSGASIAPYVKLAMRYDMRAPTIGAPPEALYRAALEQATWADRLGFDTIYLAEHHGAEDGYCPSPLVLAAAIASRTALDGAPREFPSM